MIANDLLKKKLSRFQSGQILRLATFEGNGNFLTSSITVPLAAIKITTPK
jgi:hypothetical protein